MQLKNAAISFVYSQNRADRWDQFEQSAPIDQNIMESAAEAAARLRSSMNELTIRKMRPQDVDAAMALLEAWNMAPRPPSADQPEVERTGLDVANSFVAEYNNRIVGVCSYILMNEEGWAETASLAVDPSIRGRYVGFKLQQARLEEMHTRGVRKVRTEADRPEAIRWYVERFGYRIVGTNPKKHDFSLSHVDTWTVLELDL
jgi:predicted N-acetyltransferase YhbS